MVAGDPHDPTCERLRGVVAREGVVGAHERFLRGVLGALGRPEQLPAQPAYLAVMRCISFGKRRLLRHRQVPESRLSWGNTRGRRIYYSNGMAESRELGAARVCMAEAEAGLSSADGLARLTDGLERLAEIIETGGKAEARTAGNLAAAYAARCYARVRDRLVARSRKSRSPSSSTGSRSCSRSTRFAMRYRLLRPSSRSLS